MVSHVYFGNSEPNGDNERRIDRVSLESRVAWPEVALAWSLKFNDYGLYDYHHDHNLTFPLQAMADLSFTLGRPKWFGDPQTSIGVRATYRTLDNYSNRYMPVGAVEPLPDELYPDGLDDGREWEIRTYMHLAI